MLNKAQQFSTARRAFLLCWTQSGDLREKSKTSVTNLVALNAACQIFGHEPEARSLVPAKYGVVRQRLCRSLGLDDVQMTGGLLLETLLSYQHDEWAKNQKRKPELALYDVSIVDSRECP